MLIEGGTVSLTECTLASNEAGVGANRRRSPQPVPPPRPHALMVRLRLEVLRLHATRSMLLSGTPGSSHSRIARWPRTEHRG